MKLKVCGMRETENILDLSILKPDYMGFIFWEKSSRFVKKSTPDLNKKIKKLCFISSIAAIGEGTNTEITEETEWNPEIDKTPYSYSKYGSEMEVWRASQEGVPVVIVNPGIIIGNNLNNSQI